MADRRTLELSKSARYELIRIHDTGEPPYMRERAGALLKIADGQSPHAVAVSGLLRPRDPDTVYKWLDRYEQEGVDGLRIRPGRGRKPGVRKE
jgi:hypothetical protein